MGIEFNNSAIVTSIVGTTAQMHIRQTINSVEVATDAHATCGIVGAIHADSGDLDSKLRYKSKTTLVVEDMCTASTIKFEQNLRDFGGGGRTYKTNIITITQTGTYVITQSWNGIKGDTPTYMEELHKLDRFSKSQYIPDGHKVTI